MTGDYRLSRFSCGSSETVIAARLFLITLSLAVLKPKECPAQLLFHEAVK